ncbi:MAG: hypothetical protein EB084_24850 [Proteobacteria bacterium]|nr:hypothetical protein [Pseudomonadota bacterium]
MANMSYCRFENTSSDLLACVRALEEIVNDPEAERLSSSENGYSYQMVDLCRRYLELHEELRRLEGSGE